MQKIADSEGFIELSELIKFNKMKLIGATMENCMEVLAEGNFKNFIVSGQRVKAK